MTDIKRILCPTDFSESSRHALEQAVHWASWYMAQITVLHVCAAPVAALAGADAGPVLPEALCLSDQERARIEEELRLFVEPVLSDSVVPVVRDTADGQVVAGILNEATSMPADLLVMGTHGRTGFTRMLLGSVTERVLRRAPCPVLTVPRRLKPTGTPAVQRVLCPIDFSESSLRALRYAATVAREAGADLVVLHVIELLPEATVYGHGVVDVGAYDEKFRETARARMAAAIEDAVPRPLAVTELVSAGRPYREILRIADEHGADLIVIGIQGRGSADLMLFGSTTQQVVRQATVPVLTLRAR